MKDTALEQTNILKPLVDVDLTSIINVIEFLLFGLSPIIQHMKNTKITITKRCKQNHPS